MFFKFSKTLDQVWMRRLIWQRLELYDAVDLALELGQTFDQVRMNGLRLRLRLCEAFDPMLQVGQTFDQVRMRFLLGEAVYLGLQLGQASDKIGVSGLIRRLRLGLG